MPDCQQEARQTPDAMDSGEPEIDLVAARLVDIVKALQDGRVTSETLVMRYLGMCPPQISTSGDAGKTIMLLGGIEAIP
jgi:hypothetical protein